MIKNKHKTMRNNSHRYNKQRNEIQCLKGLFSNVNNLNPNSPFGNQNYGDSSDDDEPGKRSFTQEIDYTNKKNASKQIQNANYQSMVNHKQKLLDKSLNKLNHDALSQMSKTVRDQTLGSQKSNLKSIRSIIQSQKTNMKSRYGEQVLLSQRNSLKPTAD